MEPSEPSTSRCDGVSSPCEGDDSPPSSVPSSLLSPLPPPRPPSIPSSTDRSFAYHPPRNWLLFLLLVLITEGVSSSSILYLHDGSPLFGEELTAPNGKLVNRFLGIPFAEPPVGNLRFRKPKPNKPWRNILNATVPPDSCVQSLDYAFGEFYGATMWNANTKMSEDCLYLNVFVPGRVDPEKKLAVMVWVFGGGFWSGTSTLDVYDGRIFPTEENIILVSMNYRVSIFGFFYLGTPEAPGNMGLWDQQVALKWVHKNIDIFGGDNTRITLFGESAGAASVNMHMISEKSRPYFHRAIIQSGSATAPWAMEPKEVALFRAAVVYNAMKCGHGNMTYEKIDIAEVYKCVMAADHALLREHEWAPVREFNDFPWVPVVDGDFLIEPALTSVRDGHFQNTQLLAGSNLDESIYFIVYQLSDIFPLTKFFTDKEFIPDLKTWRKGLDLLLPRPLNKTKLVKEGIIQQYQPSILPATSKDWVNALDKALGDFQFTCNVNEMALAHAAHGGDTFYYYFTHRATMQTWPSWMGVLHGYEINFIFGEPYNRVAFNYTREEQELSSRFMRYWANFARTGDPNKNEDGSYTPDPWPKYNAETMEYMNMTTESDYAAGAARLGSGPRTKECRFWKEYVPLLMAASDEEEEELSVPVPPSSSLHSPLLTPVIVALSLYGLILLTAICLISAPRLLRRQKIEEEAPPCTCHEEDEEEEEEDGPRIYMTSV